MKWFKHDSRANRDAKIEKLMLKYGAEGFALYWLCIELIADRVEADCLTFELEHDAETLGNRLKIDTLLVDEIMRWMVREGLFEGQNDRITCLKLAKRIDNSLLRSPELLKLQGKIRDGNTTIIPDNSESFGIVPNTSDQIRLDKIRLEDKENIGLRPLSGNPADSPDVVQKAKLVKYPCEEVLTYLNLQAEKRFTLTKDHKAFIEARFKDGFSLDDFKKVIDNKVATWKTDPKMAAYLRPETLFRPSHFQSYLNESPVSEQDEIEAFLAKRRVAQ